MEEVFQIGDRVRVYDFSDRKDCFKEGKIIDVAPLTMMEKDPDKSRYHVRVNRTFWMGEGIKNTARDFCIEAEIFPFVGDSRVVLLKSKKPYKK